MWFDVERERYCWYEEVPASRARGPVRRLAEHMLAKVRRDLGMPDLRIRWYREKSVREAPPKYPDAALPMSPARSPSGLFDHSTPDTIWLRTTATPLTAALSVAHEARHAWQHRRWGPAPTGSSSEPECKARLRRGSRDAWDYERKLRPLACELCRRLIAVPVTRLVQRRRAEGRAKTKRKTGRP